MVDRDHHIPSNAVVQGSSDGKTREDSSITTVARENHSVLEDSGDKGLKEKHGRSLKSSAAQADSVENRNRPFASAKESPASSPRLPVGKMKWSQSEEREPLTKGNSKSDGEFLSDTGYFPEAEDKLDRDFSPGKETELPKKKTKASKTETKNFDGQNEGKESPKGKKIPVGVLKWRKDEEMDGAGKGNFPGKEKLFGLFESLPGNAEESGKEPSNASRRLRKVVKILWVPTLLLGSLLVGLIIGYAGLGDQSPMEVFDLDLWKHIYQLVYG